jgi:uncharacterized protein YjiS (DUF1127 family)
MFVNLPLLVKLPILVAGLLFDWLGRRADQRALLKATDDLSASPADMLSDIGISRDDIETARWSGRRVA